MPGIQMVNTGSQRRVARNPEHSWQVRQKPFLVQPVCFAPVLPGETLKNALFQVRAVSAPIVNPLIGWWKEYYWFYVKHRDLAGTSDFQSMMINPGASMAAQKAGGASVPKYRSTNQIDWQTQCLNAIVDNYFRGENEAPALIDSMPVVQVNKNGVFDSGKFASAVDTGDFNVDLNANATITAGEVERALVTWEFLKANNLTDMSYEDYLRTYGVKVDEPKGNIPELLRYTREWVYPSNTIDPLTGTPTSAVSWAISERIDKDRFFKEPGFIVGLTCSRPKVYFSAQRTAGVNLLDDAYAWLPALMRNDPATSLKRLQSNATDSITTTTGNVDFVLDVRDLFVYGDQFVNFALNDTAANFVALPTANMEKRYVATGDIDALFKTANKLISEDGVVRFSILGTQMDQTPRGSATGVVV